MDRMECKIKLLQYVCAHSADTIAIGEYIYKNPELGYKEFNTSRYAAEMLRSMGLSVREFSDIPGVKATLDTGEEGPGVAILGELDAILCRQHPDSHRETGAVHACGHNAQMAAMLGAAAGLTGAEILDSLSGRIHFIAVPAEEYIELAYRISLRDAGIIRYLGGKPELLYRGWFDDVDMCLMMHTHPGSGKFCRQTTWNGFLVKMIRFIGKTAHAAGNPEEGVNALYAAQVGLAALNALRETFPDGDAIRVHPILTHGGEMVNMIPDDVRLETYVRGRTMEAIHGTNRKVNRAFAGGAAALGAKVQILDMPGYLPFLPDSGLDALVSDVMESLAGKEDVVAQDHMTGSTDLGDLSCLMPCAQPGLGGASGILHGTDFMFTEPDTAYVLGAKCLALAAADLLWGDAAAARNVAAGFHPVFPTKQAYFDYVDKLNAMHVFPEKDILCD